MQVSNLDILNIAALDYHVARMLGLGYLDIKDDVFGNEYIYITEYYTNQNLISIRGKDLPAPFNVSSGFYRN
jgi:hypothetical protein